MTDGIKIASLEVQGSFTSNGLRFHFIRGGDQSLASFRGEDDIIPAAAGRYPGQWIADTRDVALHGVVAGTSRENFRTNAAALLAVMDPSTLVTITAYPPNFGLGAGDTATLANCRPMRIVGADPSDLWYEGWELTLEFVCIDSPPDWSVTEGS